MRTHFNLTKSIFAVALAGCFGIAQAQSSTPAQSSQTGQGTQTGQSSTTGATAGQRTGEHAEHGTSTTGQKSTTGTRTQGTSSAAGTQASGDGSEMMVGKQDHQFMIEAAQSNMMEIQAAQLAQQKATSDEVKQFAKQLEQDHTAAGEKLKALAAKKNVTLPSDMGPKHQSHAAKLQAMSDAQFEKNWLKNQVQHHKKDVSQFQKQVDRSMDSDVKEFAQSTLPKLQEHLQQVQQLSTSTGTRARSMDSSSSRTGQSSTTDSSNSQGSSSDANKTKGQSNPSTQK